MRVRGSLRTVNGMKRGLCVAIGVAALAALSVSPASAKTISGASNADAADRCDRPAAGHARVKPGYEQLDLGTVTRAQQRAMERKFRRAMATAQEYRGGTIRVPTRVHVIRRNNASGGVTNAQVDAQIEVLNQAFRGNSSADAAPTPFRFVLKSVDRTNNTDWHEWTFTDDDRPAKRALHQGGTKTLNIYTASLRPGLFGYSFFPVPTPEFVDGVVLLNETLPGGDAAPYNLGDTAVHHVGHWLNLYHTFENNCATPGDKVNDTPYEKYDGNPFACNEAFDSCPAKPGTDPVHNFMSYGNDACLDQFTAGQATRMTNAWNALRA